jgi:hypothetical protein
MTRRTPGLEIAIAAVVLLLLGPEPARGVTQVCGSISSDTVWTGGEVYVIDGCTVAVEPGATLRIEPGTIIKMWHWDWKLRVRGTLIAEGTAVAPIVFTSLRDDRYGGDTNADGDASAPAPGDWGLLAFDAGAQGRIQHARISYGGYFSGFGLEGMVESRGASDVSIEDVTIASSASDGIYVQNSSPLVLRTLFSDNARYGIEVDGLAPDLPLEISDCEMVTADPAQRAGLVRLGDHPTRIRLQGNRAEGSGWNGLVLEGDVVRDLVIDTTGGVPLIIESVVCIAESASLTVPPGTIFKFRHWDWRLRVRGMLLAEGTAERPIVFTSLRDDAYGGDTNGDGPATVPAAGDWGLLSFEDGGSARITHAFIGYGGFFSGFGLQGMVESRGGGDLRLEDVAVESSLADGVYVENATVLLRGRVVGNWFGIRNETPSKGVVDARRVWWGDASGPRHRTNPASDGDEVSDGVLFFPWAVDEDQGGGFVIQSIGPNQISPGESIEMVIAYANLWSETVENAVVVLALPRQADLVSSAMDGAYWSQRHQVFWKLGDIPFEAEGRLSVRLRYRWGVPSEPPARATAWVLGTNFTTNEHLVSDDVFTYLDFVPRIAAATELSEGELERELGTQPEVQQLYSEAIDDGFALAGARTVAPAGSEPYVELLLINPPSLRLIVRQGGRTLASWQGPDSYGAYDVNGGMRLHSATLPGASWGAWADVGSTGAAQTTLLQYGPCMRNCVLLKAWRDDPVDDVHELLATLTSAACDECWQGVKAGCVACKVALRDYEVSSWLSLRSHGSLSLLDCHAECQNPASAEAWRCRGLAAFCYQSWTVTCVQGVGGYQVFECDPATGAFVPAERIQCDPDNYWVCRSTRGPNEDDSYLDPTRYSSGPHVSAGCYTGTVTDCRPWSPDLDPWLRSQSASTPRQAAQCPPSDASPSSGPGCATTVTRIRVARDPNAKQGPPGDVLPGQLLDYAIEYENVGEGRAFGVYITDELSPQLDETTLDLAGAGRFVTATRMIVWDIGELAPKGEAGSKGEVRFSVRARSGLPSGTVITNQAVVYFPSVPEETATNGVVNVVQPLVAEPQRLATSYGTPLAIVLGGRDVSDMPLSYSIAQPPLNGALSGTPPNLTYTPAGNFTGHDRFTFTVSNGVGTSRAAEVTIVVSPSPADTIAPEVSWTSPENGAVIESVPAGPISSDDTGPMYAPPVLVGFSETMDAATIATSSVSVVDASGQTVAASVLWDGTLNQAVLLPRAAWRTTTYTATVETDARDASGNALAADHSWTFRIGAAPPACTGDCDGDGQVTIAELIRGVTIALGTTPITQCSSFDANNDGQVSINELIAAVNNALGGCTAA